MNSIDRDIVLAGSVPGWVASVFSLVGITLGTLYQKRYCGLSTGNLIQYIGVGVLFARFRQEVRRVSIHELPAK